MTKKLTDWFPADVEPVRDGVYEVMFIGSTTTCPLYSRWYEGFWRHNGECMIGASTQTAHSYFARERRSDMQWRGLASNPSKGKK